MHLIPGNVWKFSGGPSGEYYMERMFSCQDFHAEKGTSSSRLSITARINTSDWHLHFLKESFNPKSLLPKNPNRESTWPLTKHLNVQLINNYVYFFSSRYSFLTMPDLWAFEKGEEKETEKSAHWEGLMKQTLSTCIHPNVMDFWERNFWMRMQWCLISHPSVAFKSTSI